MGRVMIVDDDYDILRYCDAILAKMGHEVLIASESPKALHILSIHKVDLLVLDIVMPLAMDGFELLRAVKNLPQFKAPILMLSGRSSKADVLTAVSLGATDYVCKPLDQDVLTAKVSSILNTHEKHPEIKFARGSTYAHAEVTFPSKIISVSEMGLTLKSYSPVERNVRIQINTSIFREIGMPCPPLRVASCRPVEANGNFHYEVFVSFIGLNEATLQKIRRWITARTIALRKAD